MTDGSKPPEIPDATFERHLGSGGFSEVMLYQKHKPSRKIAVKLLKVGLSQRDLDLFHAEADAMAAVSDHDSIVSIYAVGITAEGHPYLEMQYCPPPDLGARVARDPFSVQEALRTGVQIASAVETAHRAGILHRDIKPANILVTSFGRPALTDFGIAVDADDTGDGADIGVSVPWAPPEVLSGRSNGSVASDVYSLAATIHHLLTGHSPFYAPGPDEHQRQLMNRVFQNAAPPTGRDDAPRALDALLQRALAKDPAARPRSALAFAEALRDIERQSGLSPTEISVMSSGATTVPATESETRATRVPPKVATPPADARETAVRSVTPRTVARPKTPAAATPRERREAPRPTPVGATVQRPRAATEPVDVEPTTRAPASRRGWVVVAALAIIVALVGVILLNRPGDTPKDDPASPVQPKPDPILDDTPQGALTIARFSRVDPQHVRVSWTWSGKVAPADFFVYTVDGSTSGRSREPRTVVKAAKGWLCFSVHLVRDSDKANSQEERRCGKT